MINIVNKETPDTKPTVTKPNGRFKFAKYKTVEEYDFQDFDKMLKYAGTDRQVLDTIIQQLGWSGGIGKVLNILPAAVIVVFKYKIYTELLATRFILKETLFGIRDSETIIRLRHEDVFTILGMNSIEEWNKTHIGDHVDNCIINYLGTNRNFEFFAQRKTENQKHMVVLLNRYHKLFGSRVTLKHNQLIIGEER